MGNEDFFAPTGPGSCFRSGFLGVVRRHSAPAVIAKLLTRGIRSRVRRFGGPQKLIGLGTALGVISGDSSPALQFHSTPAEIRQAIAGHSRARGSIELMEAGTLQWAAARVKDGMTPPSGADIILHYCMMVVRSMFISRILGEIQSFSAADRNKYVDDIELETKRLLKGADSDVVTSLVADPSGNSVKAKQGKTRSRTEVMVNEEVQILMPV